MLFTCAVICIFYKGSNARGFVLTGRHAGMQAYRHSGMLKWQNYFSLDFWYPIRPHGAIFMGNGNFYKSQIAKILLSSAYCKGALMRKQ